MVVEICTKSLTTALVPPHHTHTHTQSHTHTRAHANKQSHTHAIQTKADMGRTPKCKREPAGEVVAMMKDLIRGTKTDAELVPLSEELEDLKRIADQQLVKLQVKSGS